MAPHMQYDKDTISQINMLENSIFIRKYFGYQVFIVSRELSFSLKSIQNHDFGFDL